MHVHQSIINRTSHLMLIMWPCFQVKQSWSLGHIPTSIVTEYTKFHLNPTSTSWETAIWMSCHSHEWLCVIFTCRTNTEEKKRPKNKYANANNKKEKAPVNKNRPLCIKKYKSFNHQPIEKYLCCILVHAYYVYKVNKEANRIANALTKIRSFLF